MTLNLAHLLPSSRANGPGLRAVLWVQGCSLRCPGCRNPRLWSHGLRRVLPVGDLVRWVLAQDGRGLTLSGGEPFEQARALAPLCRTVRAAGRDVVAFSGFTRAQLEAGVRPSTRDLLAEVDLLVDGPFVAAERSGDALRGSRNQALHFLSGRIRPEEVAELPRAELVLGEHVGVLTGFPPCELDALWRHG